MAKTWTQASHRVLRDVLTCLLKDKLFFKFQRILSSPLSLSSYEINLRLNIKAVHSHNNRKPGAPESLLFCVIFPFRYVPSYLQVLVLRNGRETQTSAS